MSELTRVGRLLRPKFPTWVIANIGYVFIVLSQYQNRLIEPGQGGTGRVFLWPMYWGRYTITDAGFSGVPISWALFLANYLLGVIPLFVPLTLGWNLVVPSDLEKYQLRFSESGRISLLRGTFYFVVGIVCTVVTFVILAEIPERSLLLPAGGLLGSVTLGFVEIEITPGQRFLIAAIATIPLLFGFVLALLSYRFGLVWIVAISVTVSFLAWVPTDQPS